MAAAITVCEDELDGLTSENISEVEPDEPGTEEEPVDFPEGTVQPDEEVANLIADVIKVADEFRPAHTKLSKIIEASRVKIVLLKSKFGVRQGMRGSPVLVGKTAMLWEEFVIFYFGVTPRRLNQLLDVRDDKDLRTITTGTPNEEKTLYKKGYAAGLAEAKMRSEKFPSSPDGNDPQQKLAESIQTPHALWAEMNKSEAWIDALDNVFMIDSDKDFAARVQEFAQCLADGFRKGFKVEVRFSGKGESGE